MTDYAYFLVGKGSVLSRFRIRLSVLDQHPSTLVALLAGADAVRSSANTTHILPKSFAPRRCLRSAHVFRAPECRLWLLAMVDW